MHTIFEFHVDYNFSEYNKKNMPLNMKKLGSKYGKTLHFYFCRLTERGSWEDEVNI